MIGDNYRQISPFDRWVFDASGNLAGASVSNRSDKEARFLTAEQAAAVQSLVSGACISGEWRFALSLFRLRITGTGTVTMDSRDSLGNITLNSSGPYTAASATDQIEFPYAGDNARQIRLTFPATATVEVI